jgi:hypothetical protein
MAGLGITLHRATGARTPFSVITLEEILTHLGASSQAYVEFDNVAFWKAGSQALLLMDVQVNRNRALLELFALRFVSANPFGLGFRKDADVMTLSEALQCVGYIGPVNLDALCMQVYDAGAAPYVNPGQLVVEAARLLMRYEGFPGAPDLKDDLAKALRLWGLSRDQLHLRTRQIWAAGFRPAPVGNEAASEAVGSGFDTSDQEGS